VNKKNKTKKISKEVDISEYSLGFRGVFNKENKTEKISKEVDISEYSLGFRGVFNDLDVRACFRDAVMRIKQIYLDRMIGRIVAEDDETKIANQKLLDGDLEYLVPPGHTINIEAQPQVILKPTKLVLDDESANWYDVVDIKIGKNSQLISTGRLPGTGFKASVSPILVMDTVQISMFVTISLANVSNKSRRFPRAMMVGRRVD
jgi:hypothetical protein